MASTDDDKELKIAIALSIEENEIIEKDIGFGRSAEDAIHVDSDKGEATTDDDATTDGESELRARNEHNTVVSAAGVSSAKRPAESIAFLGLDRKQMEQERLARKRKPSMSPPQSRKTAKSSANIPVELSPSPDKALAELGSQQTARFEAPPPGLVLSKSLALQGTVKKTWAFGQPRQGDDIKLEEVLQKHDLNLAVLSSFQWDMDWLFAKLDLRQTQLTLVMQAKDDVIKQQYQNETAHMPNLRLCFPSMDGQINCMHSKLMLLSHPTHLRIAVPTANLVPYDWGESGGIMENSVFIIDLPRLPGKPTNNEDMTFFGQELIYFCKAMGLERSIVDSIYSFDFSATRNLAFIHTIGGSHSGDDSWRRTGYCGLGRAVVKLELLTGQPLHIDFVTSSVGSLNMDFLVMLYLAAQGDDGTTEYLRKSPPAGRSKAARSAALREEAARNTAEREISENFHIYFPTSETVKSSKAGSAGTICFQSKWYNSPKFPKDSLRDCKSVRPGVLMHNKILYVRPEDTHLDGSRWAYVGSANCSESAWGKMVKDRATKLPKLNCRNWECGVMIKVPDNALNVDRKGLTAFAGTVPVPMEYPGEMYGTRKPWYYGEQ